MAVGLEVVFTVALADRSALVRNMVEAVCQRYGLEVVGEATTGWQLVAVCQTSRRTTLQINTIHFTVSGVYFVYTKYPLQCSRAGALA